MTDEHEHAMKVWWEADRAGEDAYVEAVETGTTAVEAHEAGNRAAAAVIAREFEALEAENARLRLNVRGWVEWHRRCDADDDCTYLNDNAWCDAEALASTGIGLLVRAALKDTRND